MPSLSKKEINQIFNESQLRLKTEWFDLILGLKNQSDAKIVVVTSKKIGNAPKRNKIRRQLKAIFHEEKLYNSKYNCIVITKKGITELSFNQLKDLFLNIYKKYNNES